MNDFEASTIKALTSDDGVMLSSIKPPQLYDNPIGLEDWKTLGVPWESNRN